jgi:opacity protein-like surface antigen
MRKRTLLAISAAAGILLAGGAAVAVPAMSATAPSGVSPEFDVGYLGYGTADETFHLSPKAATSPGETHAALLLETPVRGDLNFNVDMTTTRQLRTGSAPNPWEAGWVLWHYTDDSHFYSVSLKPNGWELGKEDPSYPGGQRYLKTGSVPAFPVGQTYNVKVVQTSATMTVYVNGVKLVSYTDTQNPYLSGHAGFYTEDAAVTFTQTLSEG